MTIQDNVFEEIRQERVAQDAQWGGPDHDDNHGPSDWCRFIKKHLNRALSSVGGFRARMIKVAALAVAALECDHRRYGPEAPAHCPRPIPTDVERDLDGRIDSLSKRLDEVEATIGLACPGCQDYSPRVEALERQYKNIVIERLKALESEAQTAISGRAYLSDSVMEIYSKLRDVLPDLREAHKHEWGSPRYLVRKNWRCCFTPYSVIGFRLVCKKCSIYTDQFTDGYEEGDEFVVVDSQTGEELK